MHGSLENLISIEKIVEEQFRTFASQEVDDEEVQDSFTLHADQALRHRELLIDRIETLGGGAGKVKTALSELFGLASKLAGAAHSAEEQVSQNLVAAFTLESGTCAVDEAFIAACEAAGDHDSEALVREIQAEHRAATEVFWHFIQSRSKIAFNTATAGEIDPAVETRTTENRVVG
jgi:ferritin-like metal-binding protein YciE